MCIMNNTHHVMAVSVFSDKKKKKTCPMSSWMYKTETAGWNAFDEKPDEAILDLELKTLRDSFFKYKNNFVFQSYNSDERYATIFVISEMQCYFIVAAAMLCHVKC